MKCLKTLKIIIQSSIILEVYILFIIYSYNHNIGSDLYEKILKNGPLDEQEASHVMKQLLNAI